VLSADVRLISLTGFGTTLFPGGVGVFVSTGAMSCYTPGGRINLSMPGVTWSSLLEDFSTAQGSGCTADPTIVPQIGLHFYSNAPSADAGPFPGQVTAVFEVDNVIAAPEATPDTYINATLGPMAGNAQLCSMQTVGEAVTIGTLRGAGLRPFVVSDNSTDRGGTVNTMCQVSGGSGGFDINVTATTTAAATSTGLGGGMVNVVGHVDGTGMGTNIQMVISSNQVTWTGTSCTVTAMFDRAPVPQTPSVVAGRIWGHVSCPSMGPDNGVRVNVNGMQVMQQCDGEADILFENCSQ
jgi:hypothetical protein